MPPIMNANEYMAAVLGTMNLKGDVRKTFERKAWTSQKTKSPVTQNGDKA
jgi:hypothetical protein